MQQRLLSELQSKQRHLQYEALSVFHLRQKPQKLA